MDDARHFQANKAAKKHDPDTPNYFEALSGENGPQYWDSMAIEIKDLIKRRTWTVVRRSTAGNEQVVPGTWAFKAKRYPDGRFRKFKGRWCLRGDVQKLVGGGSIDVWAPVVSWVTVRLMLILGLILGLHNTQIDFSNAFAQADLERTVYMELPTGFDPISEDGKVLDKTEYCCELHKSLYGQIESPYLWYSKLRVGLEDRGFTCYENLDPCLFVKHDCVAFCYVDDLCFFYRDKSVFDGIIKSFEADGDQYNWELTVEGEVSSYLGIQVNKLTENNGYRLTQTGLVDKILKATGMNECNAKPTPCSGDGTPLGSDKEGAMASQEWDYASIVGMLLYLASNSRPDIAFAVHQAARFTHAPRASHEMAVLRICRYLKGTRKDGLLFRPGKDLKVDCHVDADWCGLFGVEDPEDPVSAKSRTGYVILIADCPLMWVSKLQNSQSLSTQESEYVALSTACRDLLPIRALVLQLVQVLAPFVAEKGLICTTKSTFFEDNNACIALAKLRKITPQNRHISAKYHWFRSFVLGSRFGVRRNKDAFLDIVKVESALQKADMFTKNLTIENFRRARDLLCGW